jgi:hypothetical protein
VISNLFTSSNKIDTYNQLISRSNYTTTDAERIVVNGLYQPQIPNVICIQTIMMNRINRLMSSNLLFLYIMKYTITTHLRNMTLIEMNLCSFNSISSNCCNQYKLSLFLHKKGGTCHHLEYMSQDIGKDFSSYNTISYMKCSQTPTLTLLHVWFSITVPVINYLGPLLYII